MKLLLPFRTLQCIPRTFLPGLHSRGRRWYTSKVSDAKPLRILFCGSDEFSCDSLRALDQEKRKNGKLIASIDVMCRPGKKSGRSMKQIRDVPIKAVAQQFGLSIHERDTFTGWELPKPEGQSINLIIAVSFGLFVPPRILKSAEYGGLNVHPSLLPNFRGPAPIQHQIMARETHTGVTLQTLDEKSFDHGLILAQTKAPGLLIPKEGKCNYEELLEMLSQHASEILVNGLRDRLFVPPLKDVGHYRYCPADLKHAPKITSADREIKWDVWDAETTPSIESAETVDAQYRAVGRLWSTVQMSTGPRRIIFDDISSAPFIIPAANLLGRYTPRSIIILNGPGPSGMQIGVIWFQRDVGELELFELFSKGLHTSAGASDTPKIERDVAIYIQYEGQKGVLRVGRITLEGDEEKAASEVLRAGESRSRTAKEYYFDTFTVNH